ncbi:trypsin-like serine protease [Halosimplex carlsbadense]|uniref:trypsin-like serine protease n=1 Tax=Halosimplex carlsbadense TaxID=171164 RepID=UPI001376CC63|nr:trypsin-like serine protease [Halosimplex carlsbadense]
MNNGQSTISRRRALKSFAGVGGIVAFTNGVAGRNPVEKVVVSRGEEKEPIQVKKVPKRKYQWNYERMQNAKRALENRTGKNPNIKATAIIPNEDSDKKWKFTQLEAEVATDDQGNVPDKNKEKVPDNINNVPVKKVPERNGFKTDVEGDCIYSDRTFDPVRGGILFSSPNGSGTLGHQMLDVSGGGSDFFLTAGHVTDIDGAFECNMRTGVKTYHKDDSEYYIGETTRGDTNADWTTISIDSDSDVTFQSGVQWIDKDERWQYGDWLTRKGLVTAIEESKKVYSQGYVTGSTGEAVSGVSAIEYSGAYGYCNSGLSDSDGGFGIRLKVDSAEGDSGGPVFTPENGESGTLSAIGHIVGGVGDSRDDPSQRKCPVIGDDLEYQYELIASPSYYIADKHDLVPKLY